jgi:glycosyltransferase involved in cell wall biosynthesis
MAILEKYVISRAAVGLFHGADCFDAYSKYQKNSFLVHNIHLNSADQIPRHLLEEKCNSILNDSVIRLIYVGRVAAMKGPDDWINVMIKLKSAGINFKATWLGDGPLLTEAKKRVANEGLRTVVEFIGQVNDKPTVLYLLRTAHLLVFCHKTPESPRSLIESLISGTPIIGYRSAYPSNLLSDKLLCDKLLSDPNETSLASKIIDISANREFLAHLAKRTAAIGEQFSDEMVFRHRSALIKGHISPTR